MPGFGNECVKSESSCCCLLLLTLQWRDYTEPLQEKLSCVCHCLVYRCFWGYSQVSSGLWGRCASAEHPAWSISMAVAQLCVKDAQSGGSGSVNAVLGEVWVKTGLAAPPPPLPGGCRSRSCAHTQRPPEATLECSIPALSQASSLTLSLPGLCQSYRMQMTKSLNN